MSVMPTQQWLSKWLKAYKNSNGKSVEAIQCEIICRPLVDVFSQATPKEVQYELIQNGLFKPCEMVDLEALEKKEIWNNIQEVYEQLKKRWSGPEVPIYIFPITKKNASTNKNGVAYRHAIFLFVSETLQKEELGALITHEYNHVCRLHYLNKAFDEITLKESLLLEGLAECAVEELYGDQWLAPWLKRYTKEELVWQWQEHFLPFLEVKGVQNHFPFLYGDPLPKWIGYCIGYEIVRTYKKNFSLQETHIKSTDEILAGSDFPLQ